VKFVDGKRVEAKATIAPAVALGFGLPNTADQDKYLALQKIITDEQQRNGGRVVNPIGFTSTELLKVLRMGPSGKNYREVAEWLQVMTATTVVSQGTVFFAREKRWVTDTFHVFDRAVTAGKQMPDGTVADRNYVWLSEWQLENINSKHLVPVDLDTYRELQTHVAKALVPLLQIWLYATVDEGAYQKRYDELCQFLSLKFHTQLSKIREQLGPPLNELQSRGYLAGWSIEQTRDKKAFKIVFRHGEKFFRDRRRRLGVVEAEVVPDNDATDAIELVSTGGGDDSRLTALVARGVTEKTARRVLSNAVDNQPVQDQLEWGDAIVESDPNKIRNPAGFYVSLIRDNVTIPTNFETSRKREARAQDEVERRAAQQERQRLNDAYRGYQEREIEAHLAGLEPRALQELLARAKQELFTEFPNLRGMRDQMDIDRMVRARAGVIVGGELRFMSFTAFCASYKDRA
jgi:replication initiator protein A